MRPKIVWAVLALAGLVLTGTMPLKRLASHQTPPPETGTGTAAVQVQPTVKSTGPETNADLITTVKPAALTATATQSTASVVLASEAEHQAAIDAERTRLSSLAMNSDSESLSNILADLDSPDQEVRMAAIDAARQFEDTNAIPALRAAAMNASDPAEAIAMLSAVQWLETPVADLASENGPGKADMSPAEAQMVSADEAKAAVARQTFLQNQAARLSGQVTIPAHGSGQQQAVPSPAPQ